MPMSELRFSPRPNRADEIAWESWGENAFARARAEDKPILLSISAVWCHWCHVMDETTYSDSGVIDAIARQYVAVRVDNDRRPDINARYNMGGWPTTAFLAPDGTLLTGATYLPPDQMRRALDDIAHFYATNKSGIVQRAAELMTVGPNGNAIAGELLDETPIEALIATLRQSFDEEYGGFGEAPKFPQPEVLEFLLLQWRRSNDPEIYRMLATTLLGMSRGGMYDRVEGGFFRYSTTRDWSVPHFEKMAEDHAGLLRVLAQLVVFAPTADMRTTLVSAVRYVRTVLRDQQTGLFAGSQDADEAYFALPLEQRRMRPAPFVDRTSYTNWTCALAGAWFWAAFALDDDGLLQEACLTLDTVAERLVDADGLLYHCVSPGGHPEVSGLLTDQVAYLRATIDAHELSGEARFLQRAKAVADRIIERFSADGGGFYDRLSDGALGRLAIADRPIVENALLADSLVRLAACANDDRYRGIARDALRVHARSVASAGSFAAGYARALARYLAGEPAVRIVGTSSQTRDLRETALRLPQPFYTVATITPAAAEQFGLPSAPAPAAYLCSAAACSAAAIDAAQLRERYELASALRTQP